MEKQDCMTLQSLLNNVLPKNGDFEIFHLQSNPCEIVPIITPKSKITGSKESPDSRTVKTQHFIALSCKKKFVYALEIFVYITVQNDTDKKYQKIQPPAERLIFVSKADTNGYSDVRFSTKDVTRVILEYILKIDPNYYLLRVKPLKRKYKKEDKKNFIIGKDKIQNNLKKLSKKALDNTCYILDQDIYFLNIAFAGKFVTKICLFTRPADQYLFPGSSSNRRKHILNGVQLMKWWLHIIDNLVEEKFDRSNKLKACLKIPGEDVLRIGKHFVGCRYRNWKSGDIFSDDLNSLAAFCIPLFPDDPKSRFLHQLVEENRILDTNLRTFWFELQERQEFKLSVLVSVIGVEGYTVETSSYLPIQGEDVIVTSSLKQFHFLKNYISAEEYDTEEGAIESYFNVSKYLSFNLNMKLLKLVGSEKVLVQKQNSKVNLLERSSVVTILTPRKKHKQ